VGLPGAGRNVLEIGIVVQHHGAMVIGHLVGHADLDLTRPLCDRLADRQRDREAAAASGDEPGETVRTVGSSLRACAEVSIG
jgi:hypothetical protein